MPKLFLFSLLYISSCFAFQSDFQSDSSEVNIPPSSSPRMLANLPYSACLADSPQVRYQFCSMVSLLFGGKPFKELYFNQGLIKGLDFNNIRKNQIDPLWQNYFIGNQDTSIQYLIPTLPQLEWMYKARIINPVAKQFYWVRTPSTTELNYKRVFFKSKGNFDQNNGSTAGILRLATHLAPDGCTEGVNCSNFNELRDFYIRVARSNLAHSLQYKITWREKKNNYHSELKSTGWYYTSTTKRFRFSYNAWDVTFEYCANGSCSGRLTFDPSNLNPSYKNPGYCIFSNGTIFSQWVNHYQGNSNGDC